MKLPVIFCIVIISVCITSCSTGPTIIEYFGCTNPDACNYDPKASLDDGRCDLISCNRVLGCMDEEACNYNPEANTNDNSCNYSSCGCTDPEARNYSRFATEDDGSCDYRCTKSAEIGRIVVGIAPEETAEIRFEILVNEELALRTRNKTFTNRRLLDFLQEDYEFNREGELNSIRFSGEKEGTFTIQIYINDILSESTTYNSCYVVSVMESGSLPNQYWIGGFDCRTVQVDCDFRAYIAFRDVTL